MDETVQYDAEIVRIVRNHQVPASLSKLYLNDDMADVFFVCDSLNDSTVERIPGHRLILAAASPVFHQMFYGELPENKEIILSDCSSDGFKEFLQFFYLDEVVLTTNIVEVIQMAHKYDLPKWVDMCLEYLIENLNHETVFLCTQLVIWYEFEYLKILCERMICNETEAILRTESFVQCSSQVLKSILSMESLSCSESMILDACIDWAKDTYIIKYDRLPTIQQCREILENNFTLIRFPSMDITEFTGCLSRYPGMFNTEELEDIIVHITRRLPLTVVEPFSGIKRSQFYYNHDGFIECCRIFSHLDHVYQIDSMQRVLFSVDRNIVLHGFVVENQTRIPGFSYLKRVPLVGHLVQVRLGEEILHVQAVEIDLNKKNQVILTKPIRLKSSKEYEITLNINSKLSHFSVIALKSEPVEIGGRVKVTFKKSGAADYDNQTRGIITNLLFKERCL